jgi:hypothetical protein
MTEDISPEVIQAEKVRRRAIMKEHASIMRKELSNPPSGFKLEPYSRKFLAMKHIDTGMWNLKGVVRLIAPDKALNSNRWINLKQPKELILGFMEVFKKKYEELVMKIPKKGFSNKEQEWTGIYIHEYLVEHVCMYFSPEYAAKISKILFKIREAEREDMMKNGIDPQLLQDFKNRYNCQDANELFTELEQQLITTKKENYLLGEKVKVRDQILDNSATVEEIQNTIESAFMPDKCRRLEEENYDLQIKLNECVYKITQLERNNTVLEKQNENLKKDLENQIKLSSMNPGEQQAFQNEEYEKLKNESREENCGLRLTIKSLEQELDNPYKER